MIYIRKGKQRVSLDCPKMTKATLVTASSSLIKGNHGSDSEKTSDILEQTWSNPVSYILKLN